MLCEGECYVWGRALCEGECYVWGRVLLGDAVECTQAVLP